MNPQPEYTAGVDVERRDLKRFPVDSNALVRLAEYLTFRARLRNISADAVQVVCDSRYALLIHPGGVDEVPDPGRLIDISIALPENNSTGEFKACCRVKYCVAAGEDRMMLGLQYVSMDFRAVQQLDRFIEQQAG